MEQYADPGTHDPGTLLLITTRPPLLDAFLDTAASELVIPCGSLPDLLRTALAPLAPALDAAGL